MHNVVRIIAIVSTLVYLHPFWRMYFNNRVIKTNKPKMWKNYKNII